jgi:hypothetical protein
MYLWLCFLLRSRRVECCCPRCSARCWPSGNRRRAQHSCLLGPCPASCMVLWAPPGLVCPRVLGRAPDHKWSDGCGALGGGYAVVLGARGAAGRQAYGKTRGHRGRGLDSVWGSPVLIRTVSSSYEETDSPEPSSTQAGKRATFGMGQGFGDVDDLKDITPLADVGQAYRPTVGATRKDVEHCNGNVTL